MMEENENGADFGGDVMETKQEDPTKETTEEKSGEKEEKKRSKDPLFCDLCNVQCSSAQALVNHCRSIVHVERATQDDQNQEQEAQDNPPQAQPAHHKAQKKKSEFCEVCQCECPGEDGFELHLAGARHKKNLKHRENGEPVTKQKKKGPAAIDENAMVVKILKLQSALDQCKQPLLGLQLVTEYQDEDPNVEVQYVCGACEGLQLQSANILSHLMGIKHRMQYLRQNHWLYYKSIKQKDVKKSETIPIIEEYSRAVEAEEGRGTPTAKMSLNPEFQKRREDKRRLKRDKQMKKYEERQHQQQAKRARMDSGGAGRMDYGGVGRGGSLGRAAWDRNADRGRDSRWESARDDIRGLRDHHGNRVDRGRDPSWNNHHSDRYNERRHDNSCHDNRNHREVRSFKQILTDISSSEITSDEDASLALQVSNALTQKILEYRLTNVPQDKAHVVSEIMGDSWKGPVHRGHEQGQRGEEQVLRGQEQAQRCQEQVHRGQEQGQRGQDQVHRGQQGGYGSSMQATGDASNHGNQGYSAHTSMLGAGGYQHYDPWQVNRNNTSGSSGLQSSDREGVSYDPWG